MKRISIFPTVSTSFAVGSILLLAILSSSCDVVHAPFALASRGHYSVGHKPEFWVGVDRERSYKLQRKVYAWRGGGSRAMHDWVIFEGEMRYARERYIELKKYVVIRVIDVYYQSDGYNYAKYDYIGRVESGRHRGKLVRLNNILKEQPHQREGKYESIDARYLSAIK